MAIKLGKNPETFKKTIRLYDVNGKAESLQVEYKFRTRLQFAELMDQRAAREKEIEDAELAALADAENGTPAAAKTFEQSVRDGMAIATSRVLEIAKGWDLADDFNAENLEELEGMFPNALADIQAEYQSALLEARRKN